MYEAWDETKSEGFTPPSPRRWRRRRWSRLWHWPNEWGEGGKCLNERRPPLPPGVNHENLLLQGAISTRVLVHPVQFRWSVVDRGSADSVKGGTVSQLCYNVSFDTSLSDFSYVTIGKLALIILGYVTLNEMWDQLTLDEVSPDSGLRVPTTSTESSELLRRLVAGRRRIEWGLFTRGSSVYIYACHPVQINPSGQRLYGVNCYRSQTSGEIRLRAASLLRVATRRDCLRSGGKKPWVCVLADGGEIRHLCCCLQWQIEWGFLCYQVTR